MKAIGYFRDATDGGDSLAQQNKAFLDYCAREGLEPGGTFVDGVAENGHGQGFRELLAYLKHQNSAAAIVVVPTLETLGADALDAIRRFFQIEGLGAHVTAMSGAADPLAAWSSGDANRVGERVRAAMRRKAVKGEVLGRPPYGYKVGSRRRLELVPEEAVVVRYIFRLYLHEELGIRLIARRLNEEGLKTRRGGNWSMVSIRDILRNRVYLGTYSRFGVRVPGSHPSLVSAEDFRHVQDRLNARRTSYKARVPSQFLLSGLTQCGYCGNKLIGVSRRQSWQRKNGDRVENTYRYYQCESRTNQSVCAYHTRRAEDLERAVRESLLAALEQGPAPAQPDDAAGTADLERERDRLQQRAKSIDRRLQRYVHGALKGRLSRERMTALSLAAARDRLAVDDALDQVERRLGEQSFAAERLERRRTAVALLADEWDGMGFDRRQALVRDLAARIVVADDAVRIELRA